mmetsp:Transcript_41813/g.97997  ORF Transcript_41813/g.97997 Transcript_41813/m.97997 type:complete len:90 (-) Transcript_41813:79-348(-)
MWCHRQQWRQCAVPPDDVNLERDALDRGGVWEERLAKVKALHLSQGSNVCSAAGTTAGGFCNTKAVREACGWLSSLQRELNRATVFLSG